MSNINLAIFASGSGSNAENIFNYFSENKVVHTQTLLCNNPNALVLKRLEGKIPNKILFNKEELNNSEKIDLILERFKIDYIILAGFLLKIPDRLIEKYKGKIINIHPALLPAYGGKGMYGMNVHNAVIDAGENKSGITIHLVDELYDNGKVLFQAECAIEAGDTSEILAQKIHLLEQEHFPRIIEEYIMGS